MNFIGDQVLVIARDDKTLAWTGIWMYDHLAKVVEHDVKALQVQPPLYEVIAVPNLSLHSEVAKDLASGVSYSDVFKGSVLRRDHCKPTAFAVVHASFRNQEGVNPYIRDFAVLLLKPDQALPAMGDVITHTAKMLRGEL